MERSGEREADARGHGRKGPLMEGMAASDLFLLYMTHPFEADAVTRARVDRVLPLVEPGQARAVQRLFTAVRVCNAVRTGGLSLILGSRPSQSGPGSRPASV